MVKKVLLIASMLGYAFVNATIIETHNRSMFNALAKNNLVVVKFSAAWCGPCRAIRPTYERLSNTKEYKNITFIEVDIDNMEDLADSLNIRSIPTFVFFNDGQQVDKFTGADEAQLKKRLDSLLNRKK